MVMLLALALAAPAPAADPTPTAPKPRLFCRTVYPTGSRLRGEEICRTRAEWNRLASDPSRDTDRRPGGPGSPDSAAPPGR